MKDEYTGKHSEEVARYAMLIAEEMALDDRQKFALRLGGLLHDFGKLSIPDTIIGKSGKLSNEEFIVIKQHPMVGYDIAKHIVDNPLVLQCVKSHHERMDGRGYPEGLIGEEIPLLSRVICVADAYHAMISTRSYRQALGHDYAMSELIKYSGSQFDSDVVEAFSRSMNK
jgi:putative nucleotidyltransferase with HDIG domain